MTIERNIGEVEISKWAVCVIIFKFNKDSTCEKNNTTHIISFPINLSEDKISQPIPRLKNNTTFKYLDITLFYNGEKLVQYQYLLQTIQKEGKFYHETSCHDTNRCYLSTLTYFLN